MKPKTWTHPKFEMLRSLLDISKAETAGTLEGIWHLAATFDDENGSLPFTGEQLFSWLGLSRDCRGLSRDGHTLVQALVDSGWVDMVGDVLFIHDWNDHKPKYLFDRDRQRRRRGAMSRDSHSTIANNREQSAPSASASASASVPVNTDVPKPNRNGYPEDFEEFWRAYPKEGRANKNKAFDSWKRHVPKDDRAAVLAAAKEYAQCGKVKARIVRHATTWLNGRAWEDDRASWQHHDLTAPKEDQRPLHETEPWKIPPWNCR